MEQENIDWVFDTSREGTFPKGDGSWWRLILKYWVLMAVLICLASAAAVVTFVIRPENVPPELTFSVVMGVMIAVFCVFLVWMTFRRASRRNHERDAEDMALNCEIAQYYREKRKREGSKWQ